MRILMSAYACEPGKGSEPEGGYQTLLAAADRHEVWVITRQNNIAPLEDALADHAHRDRVHLVGIDLGPALRRFKRWGRIGLQVYYHLWQGLAARQAAVLAAGIRFDVVHHVTFAVYWGRVGVASLGVPLVLGPVGGAVATPRSLLPLLGFRGLTEELTRSLGRHLLAPLISARPRTRRADVVLTHNAETAAALGRRDATILPSPLAVHPTTHSPPEPFDPPVIAFVGRLVPWKAAVLAVRALGLIGDRSARLLIYGEGPELRRIRREIDRLGLDHRVVVNGARSRSQVRSDLSRASVLLHPALHEEGGFSVAEALVEGVPVVCLERGGPLGLIGFWPQVPSIAVPAGSPSRTARALAAAVDQILASGGRGLPGPATRDYAEWIGEAYRVAAGQ